MAVWEAMLSVLRIGVSLTHDNGVVPPVLMWPV